MHHNPCVHARARTRSCTQTLMTSSVARHTPETLDPKPMKSLQAITIRSSGGLSDAEASRAIEFPWELVLEGG